MWNRHRRKFLWSIGALGFLLWIGAYGAYSGSQSGVVPIPSFLADVKITDVLLVIFSGLLYLATMATVQATRAMGKQAQRQEQHFKRSERAYVKMSHAGRGIVFLEGDRPLVEIKVENFGRTPCRVTDAVVNFGLCRTLRDLPQTPRYTKEPDHVPNRGFLVTGDYIYVTVHRVEGSTFPRSAIDAGWVLLAYGYVEYVDMFGNAHHAGWGRYYEPAKDMLPDATNNLAYIASDEYNYDRDL